MDEQTAGNHQFTFGKHAGKTIAQVFAEHPGYLAWVVREFPAQSLLRMAAMQFLDKMASRVVASAVPARVERPSHRGVDAVKPPKNKGPVDLTPTLGLGFELAIREAERLAALGERPAKALDPVDFL